MQEDEKFLPDLLGQLQDENTPDSRKLELVQFLKEFCNFSQNLQPPQKEGFFRVSPFVIQFVLIMYLKFRFK